MSALHLDFSVEGNNFISAGSASEEVKSTLKKLGISPATIRRVAISMYEGEINMVIHAGGGMASVDIFDDHIEIKLKDEGPGIENIELAMQEGFSTAPDDIRAMGFGAGMGLPNMRKYTDAFDIKSQVGKGTELLMSIVFEQ